MATKHVFVDESGDYGFTPNSSKFLVLAALILDSSFQLDAIVKKMRRHAFNNELRNVNEIKANRSSIMMKKYMIDKLNTLEKAETIFVVYDKGGTGNKVESDQIYRNLLYILKTHLEINNNYHVIIDKAHSRNAFDRKYKQVLQDHGKQKPFIDAVQGLSHDWSGLQFADLLSWACFRKHENQESTYFDRISIKKAEYFS